MYKYKLHFHQHYYNLIIYFNNYNFMYDELGIFGVSDSEHNYD